VAALDQLRHLAVEERQQQRADVAAVDVGVGHDDDAVVAQLVDVELFAADAAAERGDQRADLVLTRASCRSGRCSTLRILPLQRQDRLRRGGRGPAWREPPAESPSTMNSSDSAGPFLAVGELARQAGDVERALAAGQFAGLARRLAGARGLDDLAGDGLRFLRLLEQELDNFCATAVSTTALDLGRDQLVLGLRGELRIRAA
jgi:hypothetical protein